MNYAIRAQNDFSYQPIPFFEDHAMTSNYSRKLDLNLYCIKRPQQTCFIRVTNPDMLAWGIEQGDMLVVEKSEELAVGDLVVIESGNKMEIYEFVTQNNGEFVLFSLSSKSTNIKTHNLTSLNIVGVVTNTIHQIKPRRNTIKFVA
ncbi:type VI secretion protein ImpA [Actinobacillus succinogenes]|uniref:Putative prophage repressor n=1 Tax=Actinobacillus succinogenes (strain ATCC 55618 / DSM 22257 / CCUG 43843 / 130Z) TaxID=339671 RepID=A6VMW7_ACTSZ|nr:S24 family peptidase [Actinobacillus succinogenes]ABR74314.1 putative prophage repressor [Actinobacillus succinogenes 130Z]PHI39262.1 type VI secretion protein ImpA [Actinobacillus succinogenes]